MKKITSFSSFTLILFLFFTSVAFAQVQARVRIIEASNEGASIDPVLRDVHRELGYLFSFTSYRLLKDIILDLTGNRPVDVPVHPGRSMEVTLVGEYKNLVELRIRIKRREIPILNTLVRLSSGRTVLIGGPRHGRGNTILAISARF
ncbi:MAG: hypothetical protein A2157_10430 [Deltaproteobacteria bacterium RBG_16_47_11]|nr:MAG: hypothetical protein A2157_10430 [Deltaproteobacteria bacterium RBG_16_47_11]